MKEILDLINQMSPYILLGFLLAGLMHAFIPNTLYKKYLGGASLRSVVNAAILVVPLPLCSCGVIPTAMSLRKEGASKGATVAFLISTPQTGVDSIIATYSLMGLPFALLRPVIAFVTALFGGFMVNRFAGKEESATSERATQVSSSSESVTQVSSQSESAKQYCSSSKSIKTSIPTEPIIASCSLSEGAKQSSCSSEGRGKNGAVGDKNKEDLKNAGWANKMAIALKYAYVEMMQDIGKWLMVGLVVAGLITVFVPDSFFALFADNSLLSMLIVLAFAIPMYLCATGSIPIAVALMMKGLSPGAALVLLMAGPAVNAASVLVISKVMGKRTMAFYIASIVIGAMAFGLGIDYLLPREWFTSSLAQIHNCEHGPSYFNIGCTVLLAILLANAFILKYAKKGDAHGCCNKNTCDGKHSDADGAFTGEIAKDNLPTEVTIKGLRCNKCKANAEKAILGVAGVKSVEADLVTGKTIIYGKFSMEHVRKAVEALGFELAKENK